jgi:hypothetical protein
MFTSGGATPATRTFVPDNTIVRPITPRSPPNALRHRPSLNTAASSPSAADPGPGPSRIDTPSTSKKSGVTCVSETSDAAPAVPRLARPPGVYAAADSICPTSVSVRDTPNPVRVSRTGDGVTDTTRSGSEYGRVRSRTDHVASTTTAFAPIAAASVETTSAA